MSAAPNPVAPPGHQDAFVGRESEQRILRASLEDVVGGRSRLLLLAGPAGIGKTRTAEELGREAEARSLRVLWGRCYEEEGAPPFWPWVQILRPALAEVGSDSAAELTDVAQLLPEFRGESGDSAAIAADSPQSRFRLFDAIAALLARLAAAAPLVLILDDLHGADHSSLRLLDFIARDARAPLLLLGCYRDNTGADHPLTATIAEALRLPGAQRVELGGLGLAEVAGFIERGTGAAPDPRLVEEIHQRTEGNPLFVKEYVRLVATQTGSDGDLLHKLQVPEGVRAVVSRRVTPLSDACRQMLAAASVIGREFHLDVLRQVEPRAAGAELAEARRAGLVIEGTRARTYRFAHAVIREALYAELGAERRSQLHGLIGEAVDVRPDREEHLSELAYHFIATGEGASVARGVQLACEAAGRAMSLLAYEDAARLCELALSALAAQGSSDDAERCAILVDLGIAQRATGDLGTSKSTLLAAAEIARRLQLSEPLVRAAINYGTKVAWGEGPFSDPVQCDLLQAALAVVAPSSNEEAMLLARLAMALNFSPEIEKRDVSSRRALDLARRQGDPATLLYALHAYHSTQIRAANCDERLAISAEMVQLADRLGDVEMSFQAQIWRLDDCLEVGDRAGVDVSLAARERLAGELRQVFCAYLNGIVRASLQTLEGAFVEAARTMSDAAAAGREIAFGADLVHDLQRGQLALQQGRPEEIQAVAPSIIAYADAFPILPTLGTQAAILLVEVGEHEAARRLYERFAAAGFESLPEDQNWLMGMAQLASVCARLEDRDGAALLYPRLLPYESRLATIAGNGGALGPVSLFLGQLATALERWDDAARHFEIALAKSEQMRARPWTARVRYEHARMLLARAADGDAKRARVLLEEARMTAQVLGLPILLERIDAELEGLESSNGWQPRAAVQALEADPPLMVGEALFRCEGEFWTIEHADRNLRLKDSKGLRYLVQLLRQPGQELLALELVSQTSGPANTHDGNEALAAPTSGFGRNGGSTAALDSAAKQAYRSRLQDLRGELEEAERFHDLGRVERARNEMDFIARELRAATGLGGRDRPNGSVAERARFTVTKGIKAVVKRIAELDPQLGHALTACVKTGTYCSYTPAPSSR